MASAKCLIQGKSENSNIYIQFSINRKQVYKRKTGFVISPKDWSGTLAQPIAKNEVTKTLKSKLEKLQTFIKDSYNSAVSKGEPITGEWLQLQIDLFNNKVPTVELDVLTNYIQKYIDDAPYKTNGKKGLGLSKSRVNSFKVLKSAIERFENEIFKGKSILTKDINLRFVEDYKSWLFNQKYSINYVGKNIDNLKTICFDADKNDFETSTQFKNIKSISESKEPEDIIYLTEAEQELIKDATLKREALINARKWLLLGCLIGQRGGDLLDVSDTNIKELNGIKLIELKQQKTAKLVAIPLLPDALEIIESGFPYKISLARFNEYIKDICQEAGINEPTKGRKKEASRKPSKNGTFPKYELITSHVCRRSFATNFYGRIPTPTLMNITAHGSERMFLNYIGKTTYDNAYQMLEYFSKLTPKVKTSNLEIVHNTGTNE
jgi:integrase